MLYYIIDFRSNTLLDTPFKSFNDAWEIVEALEASEGYYFGVGTMEEIVKHTTAI